MSRYVLDTNVISNVTKPAPPEPLLVWMAGQRDEDLFITSLTIAEVWRGLLEMPAGRKKDQLKDWFAGAEGPLSLFAGRILPFDHDAALVWARLMAEGSATGRPRSALDMVIAAIAESNDCMVITDNEKDFAGLKFMNPMRANFAG